MVEILTQELVDRGLLVEAGWRSYELLVVPKDASTVQRQESRTAYYAGAQHLWASVFTVLSPDAEPTDLDMRRMDAIHRELERFVKELKLRTDTPGGHA